MAPWPLMFPPLSFKDISRSGCAKGMRCSSSRGLAEPAGLWKMSSSRECSAAGHHSSTEGERMLDMSLSPSPKKKFRAEGHWTTWQTASFGQMSLLPQAAVAASTHQNGWSQEGHPKGCFTVCISRLHPTGSSRIGYCAAEETSWCPS